jgi:hypothetical protein
MTTIEERVTSINAVRFVYLGTTADALAFIAAPLSFLVKVFSSYVLRAIYVTMLFTAHPTHPVCVHAGCDGD